MDREIYIIAVVIDNDTLLGYIVHDNTNIEFICKADMIYYNPINAVYT